MHEDWVTLSSVRIKQTEQQLANTSTIFMATMYVDPSVQEKDPREPSCRCPRMQDTGAEVRHGERDPQDHTTLSGRPCASCRAASAPGLGLHHAGHRRDCREPGRALPVHSESRVRLICPRAPGEAAAAPRIPPLHTFQCMKLYPPLSYQNSTFVTTLKIVRQK